MSKEGFWQVRYQGAADAGIALLTFDSGRVVGVDIQGGFIDGTYGYEADTNSLAFKATWVAPSGGIPLAQGPTVSAGTTFPLEGKLPLNLDKKSTAIGIKTEYGPLTLHFTKLRDFP